MVRDRRNLFLHQKIFGKNTQSLFILINLLLNPGYIGTTLLISKASYCFSTVRFRSVGEKSTQAVTWVSAVCQLLFSLTFYLKLLRICLNESMLRGRRRCTFTPESHFCLSEFRFRGPSLHKMAPPTHNKTIVFILP